MMASVDWTQKCHGGSESKNILRHCDKTMREKDNHKNKHIDKSKSRLNWQMFDGFNETCNRLNDKLDELDRVPGANKRKDRVTMMCLETPAPADLPADKFHEWHMKVHDILRALYGEDLYFVNSYEHYDEVHEYAVAGKGNVMSRCHAHDCVIPLKNGKLNGKAFSSRRNIKRLNAEIQAMTKEDYGIDFMDGSKKKDPRTVEELKNQSELLEISRNLSEKAKSIVDDMKMPFSDEFKDFLHSDDCKLSNGKTVGMFVDKAWDKFQKQKLEKAENEMRETLENTATSSHEDNTQIISKSKHDGKAQVKVTSTEDAIAAIRRANKQEVSDVERIMRDNVILSELQDDDDHYYPNL